jgi:hypothetical protein
LRRSGALEALHLAFSSPRRLMRILRAVVAPSTALMASREPEVMRGGGVRAQIVGDQLIWDKSWTCFVKVESSSNEKRSISWASGSAD